MSYIKKYINKLYLRFGYKTKYIYGAIFVLAACIICCFLRFTESESENGSIKDYNMSQNTAVISDASAYDGTKSYEEKEDCNASGRNTYVFTEYGGSHTGSS